ncbi:MAG: glycosyltransferase family 4 protein [bacterium]
MESAGRVLILVENLSVPFDQRVWREAMALTEKGYRVRVICPKGKKFDTAAHETVQNVSIYRYNAWEAGEGFAAYLFEFAQALLKMSFLCARVFLREGFDVIQTCNPPDLLFLVALPYKVLGKRLIFDHHDLSPETYLTKRKSQESNIVHKVLLFFERMTFKTADVVISTNESYKAVAMKRGQVPENRIVIVRNGPDPQRIKTVPENPALRRGKPCLIYYIGTMGSQDGVDYLLRSAAYLLHDLKRQDFHLMIMGGGTELDNLRNYAKELKIDSVVTFTGRVPDAEVVEALCTADICVCPDPHTPLNDISTMNKTLEYMAVGKPIVSYDLKETRVSAGESSLYAASNDEKDFARKIAQLMDSPELRKRLGEIGRQRIQENLSWDHSKQRLYEAYALALGQA